mgnify:CR=1 FL=1
MVIQMTLSQPYDLYISSCHNAGGIYHCILKTNGEIEVYDKIFLPMVMYTVIEKRNLYAILRSPFAENNNSGITQIILQDNGNMEKTSKIFSTKGEVGCHLSVYDNALYAANYISGSIIKLPDKLVIHRGKGINIIRQDAPHTHYITASPNGDYIFVTDLGTDKIYIYDKYLNCINTKAVTPGSGPRHLAFSDDGQYAFCVNELSSTVAMYHISDDVFTLVDEKSTIFGNNNKNAAAAIRCRDNFVYASNRGDDSIMQFSFCKDGMKQEKRIYSGGKSPRDFDIIEDIMVCTNELTDNVTVIDKNGYIVSELRDIVNPLCVSYKARNGYKQ